MLPVKKKKKKLVWTWQIIINFKKFEVEVYIKWRRNLKSEYVGYTRFTSVFILIMIKQPKVRISKFPKIDS